MVRYIVIIIGMIVGTVSAQVGVNTPLPLQSFHFDGKKDNSTVPTEEQVKNDVVVDTEGRLGLGTITPRTKLDVRGATKIEGFTEVEGALSLKEEVIAVGGSGKKGAYLVSQGEGKSPMWYFPEVGEISDLSKVGEYSFLMTDAEGQPVKLKVEDLFQRYLKHISVPSVEFYASSTGSQSLNSGANTISVFVPEDIKSKAVRWDATKKCIEILEKGQYYFSMQIGITMSSSVNPHSDTVIGFTDGNPSDGKWIGRGVYRTSPSNISSHRGFTTYSVFLELEAGTYIYPAIYSLYSTGILKIEGIQTGTKGQGVVTNFSVTKY